MPIDLLTRVAWSTPNQHTRGNTRLRTTHLTKSRKSERWLMAVYCSVPRVMIRIAIRGMFWHSPKSTSSCLMQSTRNGRTHIVCAISRR